MVSELERKAMKNEAMPDGLEYPEQVLFQSLALLYGRYHNQLISREDAKAEKIKLLDEYEAYKRNWNMGQEWCEIIKVTELARAEFRNNPTVENGWKIIDAIEGRAKK